MTDSRYQLVEALTSKLTMMVSERFLMPMQEALGFVFNSETFAQICDLETGRYQDGSICLFADLEAELTKGDSPKEY